MHLQVVSPFRGLQLISIISRKRCTQQLVMLHNISTFFLRWNTRSSSVRSGMMGIVKTWASWQAFLGDVWKEFFFLPKFKKLAYQQVGNCYARLNFSCCRFLLLLVPAFFHSHRQQSKPLLSSVSSECLFTFGVRWCHDSEQIAAKHSPTHEVLIAPAE